MDESPISFDLTNACLRETALQGVRANVVGRPGDPPVLGEGWGCLLLPVPPSVHLTRLLRQWCPSQKSLQGFWVGVEVGGAWECIYIFKYSTAALTVWHGNLV